ncbi:MAG: PDDEXK nuclease domain-containing protein [Sedimentisphaerales bacterium]|nr:PDDEXK nuclease domain-containing protein [Sedimentisphaerales bacterium]
MANKPVKQSHGTEQQYQSTLVELTGLIETAKRSSARAVNSIMTATYWRIGQRIVECEQAGSIRAEYGTRLVKQLVADLTSKFGRGFSKRNLEHMRMFYMAWPISQTVSAKSSPQIAQMTSAQCLISTISPKFPLPWSAYVRLLAVQNEHARRFYETEAIRGGWSIPQLMRQIDSQFYERTALSKNKAAMLIKGQQSQPQDTITPEDEIKDPYVLEFLDLKDEYSESDLEDALVRHLESFLLELGGDFCFVGRQKRLRIGDEWYRMDLLFFHRRLRSLVVVDLKIGKFTHADAGQMHLYLNYVREHLMRDGENPPVGLILCAQKDEAVARYALEGLPNKVMAAEYRTILPDEMILANEIEQTRELFQSRRELSPLPTSKAKKKNKTADFGLKNP